MENSLLHQCGIFAYCIFFGVITAIIFDTFRVLRRIVKTGVMITFLEDMLFWIIVAILFFALSLKISNGEIRFFMLIGVILGATAYFLTISSFIIQIAVKIVNVLKRIGAIFINVIVFPLRCFIRLLNKPIFFVMSFGKKGIKSLKNRLHIELSFVKKFVKLKR